MRTFIRVFILSFFFFIFAFYIGSASYLKENKIQLENNFGYGFYEDLSIPKVILTKLETKPKEPKVFSSLEEAKEKSSRINFIVLGMEDVRTDTILFLSFCADSKKIDVLSIPRDTYIHRKGYNDAEDRKINSIYKDHGVEGVKKTVSHILDGVPIHHYVMLDYEGVEKIVDILGGVEVEVPFHMKYRDPTANPPLNIDIPQGKQLLDGKKSLDFIRFRKGNNKTGYKDGDLGRIKAQQKFLEAFASKASDNMLSVIKNGHQYVKTDVNLFEGLAYARNILGFKMENLNFITLPGKGDLRKINKKILSYYIYNSKEVKTFLEDIYNITPIKKNTQ